MNYNYNFIAAMNFITIIITIVMTIFQMLNSEQAIEVAGRAEELVCCLVKMAPWCPHGGTCTIHGTYINNIQSWMPTGLSQSLCDTVQSIICELFVNQEHVAVLSLLKSFLLLTNTYKKVLVTSKDL